MKMLRKIHEKEGLKSPEEIKAIQDAKKAEELELQKGQEIAGP